MSLLCSFPFQNSLYAHVLSLNTRSFSPEDAFFCSVNSLWSVNCLYDEKYTRQTKLIKQMQTRETNLFTRYDSFYFTLPDFIIIYFHLCFFYADRGSYQRIQVRREESREKKRNLCRKRQACKTHDASPFRLIPSTPLSESFDIFYRLTSHSADIKIQLLLEKGEYFASSPI